MLKKPLGFWTLLKRENWRYLKVYVQTLVSPIVSNLLFFGVFGGMFAAREVGIDGVGYLQFLVPGLCAMGAVNTALMNASSSLIIQKYQNMIQELNTYPISDLEKTLAFSIAGMARGVLVALLTYFVTIFFVGSTIFNPIGFVITIAVVSFAFSCLGLITGLVANTFDTINFMQTIIITPLTYFGGVFFEITKLPGMWADIAKFNPLFPMIDTVRYMYLGVSEGSIIFNIWYIGILTVSLFAVAQVLMKRGVGLKN